MYFVYIIKSKSRDELYIGLTRNLARRIKEHNSGSEPSTKRYQPWKLLYLEGYASRQDAIDREENLKYFGKVYSRLKRRIKRSLRS